MSDALVISSAGLRQIPTGFPNYAGRSNVDDALQAELEAAGIRAERLPEILRPSRGEVKSIVLGALHGWHFSRAWYYWIAQGPGLPPQYADPLHATYGTDVRVSGHCGCPSPFEQFKGLAVGLYHIDGPQGLLALADALKACVGDAETRAATAKR